MLCPKGFRIFEISIDEEDGIDSPNIIAPDPSNAVPSLVITSSLSKKGKTKLISIVRDLTAKHDSH
jgi:hypothetical protein